MIHRLKYLKNKLIPKTANITQVARITPAAIQFLGLVLSLFESAFNLHSSITGFGTNFIAMLIPSGTKIKSSR